MAKRDQQRRNRLIRRTVRYKRDPCREEQIKFHNKCGKADPTPYKAVQNIIRYQDEAGDL